MKLLSQMFDKIQMIMIMMKNVQFKQTYIVIEIIYNFVKC